MNDTVLVVPLYFQCMKYLLLLLLLSPSYAWAQQDSMRVGKTTGKIPYLEYGIGDDRLGGAKMGFLDTNILLRIVDSFQNDYRIRLSSSKHAYIPKSHVKEIRKLPVPLHLPVSGNCKVFGDSLYDYVSVSLPARLPYSSNQTIHPSTIQVDLYGVNSNVNWMTQLTSAKNIRNTWMEQLEDGVLRLHIELKKNQHWGYKIYYDSTSNRLLVRVKRPPVSLDIRRLKIAIDAGHGGDNSGAAGKQTKILEKDYTLLMAKALQLQLKKAGVKQIIMTRTKDTALSMLERVQLLDSLQPDLLISIHLNSSANDTIRGTSTYYRYIGYRGLSQAILQEMLKTGLKEFGNIGHFNFSLSGPTEYPNCLVEVAFLSNAEDEKRILKPSFHTEVAQKIYVGIKQWLLQQNATTEKQFY